MQFDALEKSVMGLQVREHLKIVTNGYQHTKTSENDNIYISNNVYMLIIQLKNNLTKTKIFPSIKKK